MSENEITPDASAGSTEAVAPDTTDTSASGKKRRFGKKGVLLTLLLVIILAALGVGAAVALGKGKSAITGQVRGQVCVKATNRCYYSGVPNLFVLLSGSASSGANVYRQVVSDDAGKFSFDVPKGTYYLVVSDGHNHKLSPPTDAIKIGGHVSKIVFLTQK